MLIVDDDDDFRLTLHDHFSSRDFHVVMARNGSEAVKLLEYNGSNLDVVLTDLMMPGCDGLEVLKVAKRANPLIHVVVMTGYSSMETAIESIRCGAYDYIAKPFKLVEIEILVNKILEHLYLLSENRRLAEKLAADHDHSQGIEQRLDNIEGLLSRILANQEGHVQNIDTIRDLSFRR